MGQVKRLAAVGPFLVLAALPALAGAAPTSFYVSPHGRDGAPGTKAQPFHTLERARRAVRSVHRPLKQDVVVHLSGGTYRLTRSLRLREGDAGGNGHDVVYTADKSGRSVISGGRRITGWKLFDKDQGIYRARASGIDTRQLYVNGRRAVLARSKVDPPGFTKTATGYTTTDASLARFRNPGDLVVLSNWRWKSFRCAVKSISGQAITMIQPCWHNAQAFIGPASMGLPTRLENALELLDSPREWYLDRKAGWLYYKPGPGEKLSSADVEAPAVEVLVDARGSLDHPIQNLRFEGLKFTYATWMEPNQTEGYADDQTGYRLTGKNQPQTFEHAENTTRTPGNLRFAFARGVVVRHSTFEHLGAVALDFDTGSQRNRIEGNRFQDISSAAIQLGGTAKVDHHPSRSGQVTRDNRITDNRITRAAQEYVDAAAIFAGYTTRTLIAYNEISDLPYSGISIGWGWGMTDPGRFPGCTGCPFEDWKIYNTPTTSRGNRILNNDISDYLKVLYDGGGIYSLGQQGTSAKDGELIAGNLSHGKAPKHGGNAVYTDGGSRYITARDNAMFDNPLGTDGPDGKPYGHDWGGCRPFGDITWRDNFWVYPAPSYDCYPPYPPVNVKLTKNTLIKGRSGVPKRILNAAGIRRGRGPSR